MTNRTPRKYRLSGCFIVNNVLKQLTKLNRLLYFQVEDENVMLKGKIAFLSYEFKNTNQGLQKVSSENQHLKEKFRDLESNGNVKTEEILLHRGLKRVTYLSTKYVNSHKWTGRRWNKHTNGQTNSRTDI